MIGRDEYAALPILLRYGTPRRVELAMPGRYCTEREMWMVPTQAGERYAIDMPGSQISLMTKTKTYTEQDDESSFSPTNNLQTKTEAELEREDRTSEVLIASLQTKTDAGREADDTAEMLV